MTDIEGSTRLWEQHAQSMEVALARHDGVAVEIIEEHDGVLVKHRGEGDSLFAVFARAIDAVGAALDLQRALVAEPWPAQTPLRVRMALHTADVVLRDGDYYGAAVNRCARLRAIAHGGQVLLSLTTEEVVREGLPAGASLSDLGLVRLQDLAHPEHVFQLLHPELPAEFPPLRSLEAFAHNLPVQLTSFIGREEAMTAVKRLLTATHLLTLTGSGGCGKTRLALQVAADLLEEYPDGVWLVELAALADPGLVPQAVASTLGVREEPGRPLAATLTDYLRPKALLLVLDNCEHLLAASAQLADALLRICPSLRMLASSREAMGIGGEQTYRVPSLSVPDARRLPPLERLHEFEALQLFADRARLSQATFAVTQANAQAVIHVCQRLDGIPMAIELAAARVRALPVEEIAARLDECFRLLTGGSRAALPRQQTLRALIDWSYDLLSEEERTLLRRLSVFAGGCTLEAAAAVCADGSLECSAFTVESSEPASTLIAQGSTSPVEEWQVLDLLTQLVDRSLVLYEEREGEARYRLMEIVRQYAREKLFQRGEGEAVRRRHLAFFVRWTEESAEARLRDGRLRWLEQLEREHDNLRAALEWGLAWDGGAEAALRLARAARQFWGARSYMIEGLSWLERVLERAGHAHPILRAEVLYTAAFFSINLGDGATAQSYGEQSLAIWQEAGDDVQTATSLGLLGTVASRQGDFASARLLLEKGLALQQEVGDRQAVAGSLSQLGMDALRRADTAVARPLFETALSIQREMGAPGNAAGSLLGLGHAARFEGNYAEARARYEEALALAREGGHRMSTGYALADLALVLVKQNEGAAAWPRFVEALHIWRETGNRPATVRVLEGLAQLSWAESQPGRAARLFGAAEALREAISFPLPPLDRSDYDAVPSIRAALGDEAFADVWAEGRAMPLERAVEYALEE